MSDLISDIQTIAKTKVLEDKVSIALSQSDSTLNNNVTQSNVESERSVALADGTTSTGTTVNNTTTVTVQGGNAANSLPIPNLGYIPAAENPNGTPNGGNTNVGLATLSGGLTAGQEAAQQLAQANSILNQQLANNNNNSQQDALNQLNQTDMTQNATAAVGWKGTFAGGGGSTNVGGRGVVSTVTNGAGDSTLSGQQSTSIFTNSNSSDQTNHTNNYLSSNYNSPGVITADQLSNNEYPPGSNPYQTPINAILGFDSNGNISLATGTLLAIKLQLFNNTTFPVPTAVDTAFGGQDATWANALTLPVYNHFIAGTQYTVTSPESATGATPGQCMDNAIISLKAINPSHLYTYSWWDPTSLTPSGLNFTAKWYADHRNPSSPPNTTTITHNSCTIGSSFCPATAPQVSALPATGASILFYSNGQVTYNQYDSELPTYLKKNQSVVKLNCGDGVNVINTNYVLSQPASNGGHLLSIYNSSNTFLFANYYNSSGYLTFSNITSQSQAQMLLNH